MKAVSESLHTHTSRNNTKINTGSSRKTISSGIVLQSRIVKRRLRSRSTSTSSTSTSTPASISRLKSPTSTSHSSTSLPPKTTHLPSPPPPIPPPPPTMSKLSESLKALISAPHARPGYTRAPSTIKQTFTQIARDAQSKNISLPAWVTLSTATSMTLNCPEAMTQLLQVTRELSPDASPTTTAELMREVGLKCISFNGIPRAINCLGAFHDSLPPDVRSDLSTTPSREFTPSNIEPRKSTGLALWASVYVPFEKKLLAKLAQSHPDLPVHIVNSHYANLLSDPPETRVPGAKVGRVLTSLVAIACLRAQTGVGPQVTSHVFGLRKAFERGDATAEGEEPVGGGEWLAGEEGNAWILETVDRIVGAVTGTEGTTFAPGLRAKL